MDKKELSRQEKWVLEQLEKGKDADLMGQFGGNDENRCLSGRFMEGLLTGEFPIHRRGMYINFAVIFGPLELEHTLITPMIYLTWCKFNDVIKLRDAKCKGHLGINYSEFANEVDFHRLNNEGNIFIRGSVFKEAVNFSCSVIKGQLAADNAKFLGTKPNQIAIFNGLRVTESAYFTGAEFHGPVDFSHSEITGQFGAAKAKFLSMEAKAGFHELKVSQSASFEGAEFYGPVDFEGAEIGGQFLIKKAKFFARNKVTFNRIKIRDTATFVETTFNGEADFAGAEIGGQFYADGVKFLGLGEDNKAQFNSLKVGDTAFFRDAVFHGAVEFVHADIREQFLANRAKFLRKGIDQKANFNSLKVGQSAVFLETEFHGSVDFSYAHLVDLVLSGNSSQPNINKLMLNRTVLSRGLSIRDLVIDELHANYLQVNGSAMLEHVSILKSFGLIYSKFQTLICNEVSWPKNKENRRLEGIRFENISFGVDRDWQKVLEWLRESHFNTQPYAELEAVFKRHGLKERGDEVFIAMRRQARQVTYHDTLGGLWRRGLDWLCLDAFMGYGRKKLRLLWWSLLAIFLGTFIFWNDYNMVPKSLSTQSVFAIKKEKIYSYQLEAMDHYNPFLYSVDLLLPVDLEMAKYYEPKREYVRGWCYAKILPIFGWIVVTALLAALSGIIK